MAPNTNGGVGFDKTVGAIAFPVGQNSGPVLGNSAPSVGLIKQFTAQSNAATYSKRH